jgi:hypothetical protein
MNPWIPLSATCDTVVWRAGDVVAGLIFNAARLACLGGKVIAYNQRETVATSEAGK